MISPRFLLCISLPVLALNAAQQPASPKPAIPARPGTSAVPAPGTPAPAPPPAAVSVPPEKVVITVGPEKITAAEFETLVESLPEQYRATARGPGRRQFADQLVQMKVLSQEARRRKLDQTPAFQKQLQLQRENLLAGLLYQDLANSAPVTDEALRKYYEAHQADYNQVRARHILVRTQGGPGARPDQKALTEPEALAKVQSIRKRLEAGEDFATVAKSESDDTGSAANGGDLGTFRHGQMVAAFEQAAFALEPGKISDPVKTPFGFHLIKVEQKETRSFEEAKPEIERRLRPEATRKSIEELRKEASVTVDDTYFGAPAAPAAPPSSAGAAGAPAPAPPK
jgi:peptidyl-prolyl cis-trans isomerase C